MMPAHPDQQQRQQPKKTPFWVFLLAIVGVLVFFGALAIGGIVWWVSENKERMAAERKQAVAEADAYAASHDQNECVEEGLRRLSACGVIAFTCELRTGSFTATCLQKARKAEGFCQDVPPRGEIIKTSLWVISECQRRGKQADDQRCHRLMQAVPQACHEAKAPAELGE